MLFVLIALVVAAYLAYHFNLVPVILSKLGITQAVASSNGATGPAGSTGPSK